MKIAALARQARESLGHGLQALQAGDSPEELLAVAQHLAKAMGTLVDMEAAPPDLARRSTDVVLAALREGLQQLQLPENVDLPAAQTALASVAEALNRVHQISESDDVRTRQPLGKTALGSATPVAAAPVPAVSVPAVSVPAVPVPAVPAAEAASVDGTATAATPTAAEAKAPAAPPPSSPGKPMRAVEAALGAHSATNFYKGLAGGDIVASGGLFVATYQAPEVGEPLLLKVTMPGGYAFEAKGVVAWRRDVQTSSSPAPGETPGFGAQFSEISDEGRGLIQRYVRNREPLFHDDA